MSFTKLLGVAWTAWKFAAKRLGPIGGLVVAAVAAVGYVYLGPRLAENHPALAKIIR
ncbi:hypothetical protein [Halalkalirubrum salinum]|uniref:hypothetical protein n=1 Tax=Halalkalirubrum salinum TaxID=2563889 RepID=UPI00148578E8|nr:hypothetical protein [Halalkalirubrum salinum]